MIKAPFGHAHKNVNARNPAYRISGIYVFMYLGNPNQKEEADEICVFEPGWVNGASASLTLLKKKIILMQS